ncbi:MAG: DEAD/DEAH box helicase, partial [Planctomycetes bacterium]|nr:DEAD/DEAH box helicase [Planctomycetota bacterium]
DELVNEFEASFPYEETPDQCAAISDIKDDQMRPNPMDRLLCGDVGFGKTEVAIRAAFKVANAGKQVAVLVPTTVLAEQHYRTFRERMADYPVLVGCLSRFRTPAEQKTIVEAMSQGRIDIVIGTHRLVSKDVHFADLGLVIIDEEQRFGVEHKERLKEMRASVDVLTMSATPIPRTLNMALLGLRDISNLTTAPIERHAVKTMVVKYSEELIRRAMLRELSRGGQCFFLHNRVKNIDSVAAKLSALVPEARFAIAHGQMPEKQLLNVMNRFVDHRIDVLICTTIIESGVDIPNVNTLFVNEADHFGLSELHQLRGRVGRYKHQAYAYFLVPPKRPVTPVAHKRLLALEEYSELGSGFRIAMRDLEIRGAGNILGLEQSGHIINIGFDLYCRLLEKSVAEFRGEKVEEVDPVELDLGTISYIPTEFIDSDTQRIDFYRKLSSAHDAEALQRLGAYARDRYGQIPEQVIRLFEDQRIRNRAASLGVNFFGRTDNGMVVGFSKSGAKNGVLRLRTLNRKVSPMDGARWRIELSPSERNPERILSVVEEVLGRLSVPTMEAQAKEEEMGANHGDWNSGIKKKAPKLGKIEVGGPPPAKTRTQKQLDDVSSSMAFVPDENAAPQEEPEAVVVGIEPNESLGVLHALVYENTFDTRRFGSVTMEMADGKKFWLRYTGTGKAPSGQVAMTLRAAGPEEVREIVNAHLASGKTLMHAGIVE